MESKALSKQKYIARFIDKSWEEVCKDMGIEWTNELDDLWMDYEVGEDHVTVEYNFYKEYLVPLQTKLSCYLTKAGE